MPLLIVLLLGFLKYHSILAGFIYDYNIFIISIVILFCIISYRKFLFLGEAERYLNHIAIIIIFSLVYVANLTDTLWIIYLLIIYGFIYYVLEVFLYDKFLFVKDKEYADIEIEDFLKSFIKIKTVLCYPYHNFNIWRLMINTMHQPIIPFLMRKHNMDIFQLNYDIKNTYLDLNKLDEIIEITNCTIIIIYNNSLLDNHINYNKKLLTYGWLEKELHHKVYRVYYKG